MNRRLGFSLVEVTVVLAVIVLIALIMTPRLTAMRESQRVASFRLDAERIFREAKAEAASRRTDLVLTWDEGLELGEALSDDAEGDGAGTGGSVLTVQNPDDAAEIEELRVNGATVGTDEWAVGFGANGSVDPAGISYSLNGRQLWIKIDAQGRVTSGEGAMPEESVTDWEAGELEQRI